MRRRLIKALVTAALLSIFSMCPAQGHATSFNHMITKVNSITNEIIEQKNKTYIRYTTASLNIREKPDANSKIVGSLRYNQKVTVKIYDNNWSVIKYKGSYGYVRSKYLSDHSKKYRKYLIPENEGYKSFMDYRKITDESSPQYVLQQQAYTGDYGIRMVDGRYCVAIGFAFEPVIGQYFDLVLENGTVIPCVISDEKDPADCTDLIFTDDNGCCTEFVVDIDNLNKSSAISGNISSLNDKWNSPVEKIIIYRKNVMEE